MQKVTFFFLICIVLSNAKATPLYTKCVSCHGKEGEKMAMAGKSLVINEMSKEAFVAAMKGYRDGTYGRALKSAMKLPVKNMSDEQIVEIAEFIVKSKSHREP